MVLDPFGGDVGEQYTSLLSKWKGAIYVTLAPPLLSKTDEYGTGLGLLSAGQYLTSSALQKVHSPPCSIYISGRSRGGAWRTRPLPLFLDQTEAQRAEKNFFETGHTYTHKCFLFGVL